MTSTEIFSTHDVAKVCQVTPMTVIRWIKDGKISAFKTAGGHRRILRADLARFCQGRGIPFPEDQAEATGRILVVDSDSSVRETIADYARGLDPELSIETASDAYSAGRLIATFRPNLIFIEQRLPGIDVADLCSRLSRDATPAISVVAIVPSVTADTDRSLRGRGALGCLGKPPVRAQVHRLIREALNLPEGHQATKRPTIHIIDDDVRAAKQLRRQLEGKLPGSRVVHHESMIDAIFAVSVERPDFIVLDVGTLALEPGDVIKRILARIPHQNVRIVAMGPAHTAALEPKVVSAGARSFHVKPVVVDEILKQIKMDAPEARKRRKRRS